MSSLPGLTQQREGVLDRRLCMKYVNIKSDYSLAILFALGPAQLGQRERQQRDQDVSDVPPSLLHCSSGHGRRTR